MRDAIPFWIAGRQTDGTDTSTVHDPYDGRLLGTFGIPDEAQVGDAIASAGATAPALAELPAHARASALDHVARRLEERAAEFADLLVEENGKPIVWARGEVTRASSTFRWAAEEV